MHGAVCVSQRDMRVLSRSWISEILSVLAFPLTFFLTFGLGLKGYMTDVEGVSYAIFCGSRPDLHDRHPCRL